MDRVSGKVAFITGAGQGQGRAHAVRLAEEGADIIATDICAPYPERVRYNAATQDDLAETQRLVEALDRRCVTAVADVRDRASLQAAVDAGIRELGRLDIVIGNAGVITFHPDSLEIADDVYDLIVDTNLRGVWNTIQVTAPVLKLQGHGGSIILTSSAAGLRGQTHYAHYAAAKHGVVGLMRSFANELGEFGIRVNTVHPTGVASPGMGSSSDTSEIYNASRFFPLAGLNVLPDFDAPPGTPFSPIPALAEREISQAVLFLASDESRYITGVTLPVDAGNTNKP
ncbi:mycofactocin-coupled SDR family oxidoreductase [Modestobacter excelsi]|uniref:mycofactocin-coupled SDR family oxidoreductase n=1 Tax=Modestobacter excelsi TaxID=2213161 RepID=UPI00110CC578|nr:mycofactocin-coupled SDR family oxidoreductase [Modestobacter excelsi]